MKIRISSSGLHFFNRISGLNVLFDEINFPSKLWSKAPRHVSIALTNVCDLTCSYCYTPKNKSMLNYYILINWLKELDLNGCLGVGFGGGEPTLYPNLIELCQYTTENTSLAITLTTHAHRLNSKFVSALLGYIHFIRISMDGVGLTYEFNRNRSFAIFKEYIKFAQRIAPIGINYLVNSYTFPDLDKAITIAEDLGASEFLLLPEQPTLRSNGIDEITKDLLKYWVTNYDGDIPLEVSEYGSEYLPTCNPCKNELGLYAYAHIDANGILKKTSFDTAGIPINHAGVIAALNKLKNY